MTEYVYRVVNADTGEPVKKGSTDSRQHFYTKRHVAQGVATSKTNSEEWLSNKFSMRREGYKPKRFKAQRAAVVWEDINAD